MSKETLYGDNPEAKRMNQAVLVYVLDNIVRLLHPIMPFVTEEIFSKLPTTTGSIVVASYPEVNEFSDESAAEGMEVLKEVIRAVRNIRAEVNTPLSKAVTLLIQANDEKVQAFLTANQNYIMRFCNPDELVIATELAVPDMAMSQVITGATIYLPLANLINLTEEIARLEKELAKLDSEVKRVQGKLANERFVSKAPQAVVDQERAKEADYLEKQQAVAQRIAQLKELQ